MPEPPTMSGAYALDAWDLVIAASLVLVAGLVSAALRLGLGRRLAWASLRTVVQLLGVGLVLRYVFAVENGWLIAGIVVVMIAAASQAAVGRSSRRVRGVIGMSFATLLVSGLVTTWMVTAVVIGAEPWYRPQYLIPLLGMILGNGLTGLSLCVDHLLESLATRGDQIEMELSLGATAWEAAREPVRAAVRRGMVPIINSMVVVGIVSLPGMMTGQILQGADPFEAVKYQIVVMFMLAGATSFSCMLIALAVFRAVFNGRHQLRAERIWRKG